MIDGVKVWCTGASVSDYIFVGARADDSAAPGGSANNLFRVGRSAQGLHIGIKEDKTGARGIPLHALFLDGVFVPDEDRLGGGSGGFKLVMEAFNTARPCMRCVVSVLHKVPSTTPLPSSRSVRPSVKRSIRSKVYAGCWFDMNIQTEAARNLVYSVAQMIDDGVVGKALAPMAATAKCFATDTAMKVAVDAVQLFSACGISNDYPIHRYMRDAKVLQIIEGTNQIQRNIVSDALRGRVKRPGVDQSILQREQ